jgi:hypothetical protein
MLVAWSDGSVSKDAIDALSQPGAERLLMRFSGIDGGACLEAT